MELKRLFLVFRSRWAIVVLVALIGFASAFGLTALASSEVDPVFQATIAIQFELQEEETIEDLADEINSERGIAVFAAQELLTRYPGSSIVADTGSARLVFVARGSSREEATNRGQDLVSAYLQSDPSSGGDVNAKLAELESQALEVQAEIDALQPELTDAELALKNQHDLMDRKVARIEEEILALTVADAGASPQQQQNNAARINDLEDELISIQTEKAALPEPPSEELDPVELLRLDSLQRILDFLRLEYQRFSMRTFGITGSGGTLQPASVDDLTPQPPSPSRNGAIALVGGTAIALLALALTTRARSEVWFASDVPVSTLGVVPRRLEGGFTGPSWYDASEGGSRKHAIQALRGAVEGSLGGSGSSLAILGDRVNAVEYHTLATDLASSFASVGQNVLLIDSDFDSDVQLREFDVGEPSLESFLRLSGVSNSLSDQASQLLADAMQVRPGLTVIRSGASPASAADALAAPQFRALLQEARGIFDLVIVIAGASRSPSANVVAQRVGSAVFAIGTGKSTTPNLEQLIAELRGQRVEVIGAVMLTGTEVTRIARLPLPSWARSPSHPVERRIERRVERRVEIDPVSRLRFYPFPMDKGSNPTRDSSLRTLVGGLTEAPRSLSSDNSDEAQLADDVMSALSDSRRPVAYEAVATYVVARVEDVLTAVSGQENLSRQIVDIAVQDGFMPLTTVRGYKTIGLWLTEELRWELGDDDGDRVSTEFAGLLSGSESDDPAADIDRWLTSHFFRMHLKRTDGEPEVWHLSSKGGTAQALVYGRRLSKDRLETFITNVVRRAIDEFQRQLEQARKDDELDEADRLENSLKDLHLFEVNLRTLEGGSSEEARLRYPWRRSEEQPHGWSPIWSEGIRPNIAPLQRLGLLAAAVLTPDELSELQPTG